MKTILVIGDLAGSDAYHAGDEAMTEADIALLREIIPDAKIIVTSADPVWTAKSLTCEAVKSGLFVSCESDNERASLLTLYTSQFDSLVAGVDAVVIAGGGNLSSTWPSHLYERASYVASAERFAKPVIILGQTLGPELKPRHAAVLGRMLRYAKLVGTREATSAAIASSLGVEDGLILRQADDALFLASKMPKQFPAGFDPSSRWIAVTVHPFAALGSSELVQLAVELSKGVDGHDIGLLFVPHARAGEGSLGVNDTDIALELARLTGGWVLSNPTASEAVWAAQHAYAVISTRYHPLVFASAGSVPSLALPSDTYTATKCLGAQAHTGMARWSLGLSRAIAGELNQAIGELLLRRDEISVWLLAALPHLNYLELRRQFAVVKVLSEHALTTCAIGTTPKFVALEAGAPQPIGGWASANAGNNDELVQQFQHTPDQLLQYTQSLEDALAFSRKAQSIAEEYAQSLETALQMRKQTQKLVLSPAEPILCDSNDLNNKKQEKEVALIPLAVFTSVEAALLATQRVQNLAFDHSAHSDIERAELKPINKNNKREELEAITAPLVACTIVAHNYLPLARVLANSFLAQHPHATFLVAVIDHPILTRTLDKERFEVLAITDIDFGAEGYEAMATCYDVTEFATSVKPFLLRQLLKTFECVVYLDPDIYVYAPLTKLIDATLLHGWSLTPHCLEPIAHDGLEPSEADILAAGIYNLGYIGVSRAALPFLDWWATRLRRRALIDPSNHLFTDQRWVDLAVPIYSPYIERSPAYNVAYWNIDQRVLWHKGNVPMIGDEPLVFFHFSGYDLTVPHWLCKYQLHKPRTLMSEHASLSKICIDYAAVIGLARNDQSKTLGYGWHQAFPQLTLTKALRRLFHAELVKSDSNGSSPPPSPFRSGGGALFRDWLCTQSDTTDLPLPRFLLKLWQAREDLRLQYPETGYGDISRLLNWLMRSAEPDMSELRIFCATVIDGKKESSVHRRDLLPGGVDLIGYLKAELGVGEAGRLLHTALSSEGVPVTTLACRGSINRHSDPFKLSGFACHSISLLAVNADQTSSVQQQFEHRFFENRYVIGQWFWEIETFPATFHSAFSMIDEVWVATKYIHAALSAANPTISVQLMPLPLIAPPVASDIQKSDFGLDNRFLFLFCFDMNSVFERKNPLGLVNAFCQAFSHSEGPVLVIKIINGNSNPNDLEKLRWACRSRLDIKIIELYLDAPMMGALMAVCDCYVSLHRAEGLGLTMSQAMSLGKPVIATAYSGNMDFMDDQTAYLIPWTPIRVGENMGPYPCDANWAAPELATAASTMRYVFKHPEEAMQIGKNAKRHLAENFSPEVTGKKMHQRLKYLWNKQHA